MAELTDRSSEPQWTKPAPIAQTLLDLFSPTTGYGEAPSETGGIDRRALWAADALHRANNLAQMSSSLAAHGARHRQGLHADDRGAQARALSRAYAELSVIAAIGREVPCAPLLHAIAMRLVALFGNERSIRLHVSLDHVTLPVEQRRALILIASELVINALKYAFPADTSGMISITLSQWADKIELAVADNGCGLLPQGAAKGAGTGLMKKLAVLLDADLRWFSTEGGLRVVLSMPCPVA